MNCRVKTKFKIGIVHSLLLTIIFHFLLNSVLYSQPNKIGINSKISNYGNTTAKLDLAVAYSSQNDEYFVVWFDQTNQQVWGRIISGSDPANSTADSFRIDSGYAIYPARPSGSGFDIGADEYQFGVGVRNQNEIRNLPNTVRLFQNYPNPFNATTVIDFQLPLLGPAKLYIFNISGQTIKSVNLKYASPGRYSFVWDTTDNGGSEVSSGVYIFHLLFNEEIYSEKLLLVK